MAITRKNEEAVSPVIGVILMVAITVILAAVIAAFVFGMAGNIQKTKVVAATEARSNANNVTITYQGGQDAGTLSTICFQVDGTNSSVLAPYPSQITAVTNCISSTSGSVIPIGTSVTIAAGSPGKNHVVAIGGFTDGSNQVIVDTTL